MKTFEIWLKGHANPIEVSAEKAVYENSFLTLTKGTEIVAKFLISEVQGYRAG